MRKIIAATLFAGTTFLMQPAHAATILPACSTTGMGASHTSSSASCKGFNNGNPQNQGNKNTPVTVPNQPGGSNAYNTNTFQFGSFGTTPSHSGGTTVDFPQFSFGTNHDGTHNGSGKGSSGHKGNDKDESTGFFHFNPGKNFDTIGRDHGHGSPMTPCPDGVGAVPEPATWALMILGFGGIGAAKRRGKSKVPVRYAVA